MARQQNSAREASLTGQSPWREVPLRVGSRLVGHSRSTVLYGIMDWFTMFF
jgi:hypothetical protein